MKRILLIVFMFPGLVGASECADSLGVRDDLHELVLFLSFQHPIQGRALAGADTVRLAYFLVHWSGGFRYSSDPVRYQPANDHVPKFGQFRIHFTPILSAKTYIDRKDYNDEFPRFVVLPQTSRAKQLEYLRQFLTDQVSAFILNRDSGMHIDVAQRNELAKEMLDGFQLGLAAITEDEPNPFLTRNDKQILGNVLSAEDVRRLRDLGYRLKDESFREIAHLVIRQFYTELLKRRADFRIDLHHQRSDVKRSDGELRMSPAAAFGSGLHHVKTHLLRETPQSLLILNYLRTWKIENKFPLIKSSAEPSLPIPPTTNVVVAALDRLRAYLSRRDQLGPAEWDEVAQLIQTHSSEWLSQISKPYPIALLNLNQSKTDQMDLAYIGREVSQLAEDLRAQNRRQSQAAELLEVMAELVELALPKLRTQIETATRLDKLTRQQQILHLDKLVASWSLISDAIHARFTANLTRLDRLNDIEALILAGVARTTVELFLREHADLREAIEGPL